MDFKIYRFTLHHRNLGDKEGLLLQGENGNLSEVTPFPGRSQESLSQALAQLQEVQKGFKGPLFPSVALGLFGLTAPKIASAPVALFLMGTPQEILSRAENSFGCTVAKVKIGSFDLPTAVSLVKTLSQKFRLRIDIGASWSPKKIISFCSHFSPTDFDFLEDPGHDVSPYPMAADDAPLGAISVWKPMIRGLPSPQTPLILSSSFESSIGLHQIASLAHSLEIPAHPLGIGTFTHLTEDLIEDSLFISQGEIHFPAEFRLKTHLLTPC